MHQRLPLRSFRFWSFVLIGLTVLFFSAASPIFAQKHPTGNVVKVSGSKGHWTLTVNGKPYFIKGVGVAHALSEDNKVDFLLMAKNMGVNTVRTWGFDPSQSGYLNMAQSYGLLVDVGFWLNHVYPDGTCSYLTDTAYMERVRRDILTMVQENKDHPAILAWNLGNETIFGTKDEKERIGFCRFLEKLIQDVHRIDPDHPVIYSSAYIEAAPYIIQYVPSLDILGINVYGDVKQTHVELKTELNIPIVFTEFGPLGPWDLPKDNNQRPIEFNDKDKAEYYVSEAKNILAKQGYNLGGFVFNLGSTTQSSMTWWNLNDNDSVKLSYLKMRNYYTGKPSAQKYPFIIGMSLSKENNIHPGEYIEIAADVVGTTKGISYTYMLSTEIDEYSVEWPNTPLPVDFDVHKNQARMKAPQYPGIYRVYAVITDKKTKYTSTFSRSIHVIN